jgi:hypothetical protein
MAITVQEKYGRSSTEGESPTTSLKYIIKGTDDETEAKNALKAQSPTTHDGLYRKNWKTTENGPGLFDGEVTYGIRSNTFDQRSGETPPTVRSFDTIGGSLHIKQSIETLNVYYSPALPSNLTLDYKGAIGFKLDGTKATIEGCNIVSPIHQFSETHYFAAESVDFEYIRNIRDLTGHVNRDTFRDFAPYEVLFMGASGILRNEDQWEINYKFASQYNNTIEAGTDLTIGDITGIEKNGWDYLWVDYVLKKDVIANALIEVPRAVFIEKVYFWGNFDLLRI